MKYTDFVKEVSKYGWERTRFQGHAMSVESDVVFVHHNKDWEMDAYYYLSALKHWYHSYDVMFGHMKNYDLFTMEKLKCTRCGGKVHYNKMGVFHALTSKTFSCRRFSSISLTFPSCSLGI